MNYTQNEKIMSITEKTLVIGIDIAKKVQYTRAFDYRGIEFSKIQPFENTSEGFKIFEECAKSVAKENQKNTIIVGLEPTGHYWFNLGVFLRNLGIKVVLLNPFHVKRSKELDELALQVPGVKEMLTIKGVGIISAAGFVAEVGDIKRFTPPSQIQKLVRILFAIMNKQFEYNPQKLIKRSLLK